MTKVFILLGIIFILIGLLYPYLSSLGLGKLPGDIVVERKNFNFYFPITTSIILSILISLLFKIFFTIDKKILDLQFYFHLCYMEI